MREASSVGLRRMFATALFGLSLSAGGFAEDATQLAAQASAPSSKSKVIGTLDLRGEYMPNLGAFDTSNYAQLGYQFTPDFKVNWYQGFDSNLYNSSLAPTTGAGMNPVLDQGFLRTRVSNIWKDGNLSFGYESRIYVPTWKPDIEQGSITRLYNAFKLSDKVSDKVTLTAVGVVMPQFWEASGTPKYGANSNFQDRIYLVADFQFTEKISLDFPILLYQTFNRSYADGAANNGTTTYLLYIWPELDYAINDTLTVGLAFVSDNFVKADFTGFTPGNAFKLGTWQFVVTTNL